IDMDYLSNTGTFHIPETVLTGFGSYRVELEYDVTPVRVPTVNNCPSLYSTKKPVFPPLSKQNNVIGDRDSETELQRQRGEALAKDQLGAQIDTLLSKLYPAPNIPPSGLRTQLMNI